MTSRLMKIGDALSQLFNVMLLPNHKDTTANESISGRSHRCGWKLQKFIDFIFSPFEKEHCRQAYLYDLRRAEDYIRQAQEKANGKATS